MEKWASGPLLASFIVKPPLFMNGHAYYVMDRRQQRVFLYPPRGRIHGDSCPRRSRHQGHQKFVAETDPRLFPDPTIERYDASIDARRIECLGRIYSRALNTMYIYIYICMIVDAWKRVNWNGREGKGGGGSREIEKNRWVRYEAKRREASWQFQSRSLVRRRSIKL